VASRALPGLGFRVCDRETSSVVGLLREDLPQILESTKHPSFLHSRPEQLSEPIIGWNHRLKRPNVPVFLRMNCGHTRDQTDLKTGNSGVFGAHIRADDVRSGLDTAFNLNILNFLVRDG